MSGNGPMMNDAPEQGNWGDPSPSPNTPAAQPAQNGGGMWQKILMGALVGLAGGAGQKSFGAGLSGGAKMSLANAQQQRDNEMAQQQQNSQIKFRDAQTAAMVADTTMKDQQLHNLPQAQQDEHNKNAASVVDAYTKTFGHPTAIISNTGDDAMEHLKQVTAGQGAVDHMLIVNTGDKLVAWDTAQAANSQDALGFVKSAGSALGLAQLSGMTPEAWKALPAASKNQFMQTANDVHGVTVPDPKNFVGQMSRLQSEQRTLQAKVVSDPTLQPLLDHVNSNLDLVKGAYEQDKKDKAAQAAEAAAARGKAYGDYKTVDVTDTATGVKKKVYAKDAVAGGMPTGSVSDDLQKNYIKPANDAEKAYGMFNEAYADYKKGTKTGAPSMLALSQHLATTFGGVKGSRLTKDMIQEHLGARSVSDKALVAMQKFTNGDVLSPDQWNEFRNLIGQSRSLAWATARKQAAAQGVNIRQFVPKDLGGTAGQLQDYNQPNPAAAEPQQQQSTGGQHAGFSWK